MQDPTQKSQHVLRRQNGISAASAAASEPISAYPMAVPHPVPVPTRSRHYAWAAAVHYPLGRHSKSGRADPDKSEHVYAASADLPAAHVYSSSLHAA